MGRRPTRAMETRAAGERYIVDNHKTGLPHVPHDEIPDDMEYRWVAEFVRGALDEGNVMDRTSSGWRAVPAERHPRLASGSLFPGARASTEEAGIIRFKGLVLCEKPRREVERERAALLRENIEIMQSTPGLDALPTGYIRQNAGGVSHTGGFQGD